MLYFLAFFVIILIIVLSQKKSKSDEQLEKDRASEREVSQSKTNIAEKYASALRKDEILDELEIKVVKEKIENFFGYIIKMEEDDGKAKFSLYIFDITDPNNKIPLTSNTEEWHDEEYLLFNTREMKIEYGAHYLDWSGLFALPEFIIVPPYKGKRKLEFKLYATSLKTKFTKGKPIVENEKNKINEVYLTRSAEMEIQFDEPGYLEVKEFVDEVNERTVQLGLALANSDDHMDQREINIVKDWIDSQYHWSMFDYLDPGNENKIANEQKIKFSFIIKNSYDQLKDNRLSMSEIIRDLNAKATKAQKYDVINLLLNIAGSDEKLSIVEDKLLNKTARALNLDIEQFQKMKNIAIANIESIEHSEQFDESVFNITESMSNAEKCKLLRKEYTRWNAQTNNANEKLRTRARKMVELAAASRKKYNC